MTSKRTLSTRDLTASCASGIAIWKISPSSKTTSGVRYLLARGLYRYRRRFFEQCKQILRTSAATNDALAADQNAVRQNLAPFHAAAVKGTGQAGRSRQADRRGVAACHQSLHPAGYPRVIRESEACLGKRPSVRACFGMTFSANCTSGASTCSCTAAPARPRTRNKAQRSLLLLTGNASSPI